jgi:hypothetical protein
VLVKKVVTTLVAAAASGASTPTTPSTSLATSAADSPIIPRTNLPTFSTAPKPVKKHVEWQLLNVFGALPTSPLGAIVRLFTKLEPLSHILVWSASRAWLGENAEITLVELPRLNLKFQLKLENNGTFSFLF